jgi:hypothetical protein
MLKLNPLAGRSAAVAEGISDGSVAMTIDRQTEENDVVNISNEEKKRRVMGQLIAKIYAEAEGRKPSE